MRRVLAVMFGAVVGALAFAAPAWAHTSVKVDPAVAGSPNALVTVSAEAESDTAGITSLRVVLPAGIAPADVTYVDGPPGWALQPDAEGYVVSGPALAVGRDAVHRVRVKQLPSTPTLVFKLLQTYTGGRVDRWIEVPKAGAAEPEFPAPVVTLAAPPGGFPPSAEPSSAAPSGSPAQTASPAQIDPTAVAGSDTGSDSKGPLPWVILGVVVVIVLAAAGGLIYARRRG